MKKCHIHRHMTVATLDGQKTLIYNWSCVPHGIYRKAFRNAKARNTSLEEHLAKKVAKSS